MKIICVGRNYVEHAHELNNEVPDEPIFFLKPDTALLENGKDFHLPDFSNEVHYEVELVVKINKDGKDIPVENAHEYYNEITLGIDFTARDIQSKLKEKSLPWEKAKAFDESACIGGFIPINSIDKTHIDFRLEINGKLRQKASTEFMIFTVNELIAESSLYFTLKKGDLLFTGTPKGVGKACKDDIFQGYLENMKILAFKVV